MKSVCRKTLILAFLILIGAFSLDAQTPWKTVRIGASEDLVAVFFTSSDRGFVAGDKGYFNFTLDGGKTWIKQFIKTDENINEIYFRNNDNGYIVAGKQMFLTADGGRSWTQTTIYRAGDFVNLTPEFLSINFADKKRGVIIGSLLNKDGNVADSLVMRTEDGGNSWQRVRVPSKTELYDLDFADSSHGWIVGDKGLILATFDGGANWQIQTSGTDKPLYSIDFRDADEGYAVGGKGTILRTQNGGQSWESVKTNFPNTFLRVNFADDKNGWIVGYGGTILRSSDKGRSWIKQESGTKENLYGLFMTKKYGWAVGAKGLIMNYQK